jgi:hypothetical protein
MIIDRLDMQSAVIVVIDESKRNSRTLGNK